MKSKKNSKLWDDDQKDYWTRSWENSNTSIEEITAKVRNSNLILPSILEHTPEGSKVLEAGCGRGQWVICLDELGYDITGLDFSEPTIKKLKQQYPHLKFVVGDVTDFDFKDETFDAMLSWGVIEHFEEGPFQALNEARRVLKKGGLLFITVPCKNYLHILLSPLLYAKEKLRKNRFIRRFRKKDNLEVKFYQHEFRRKIFSRYVLDAGFEIMKMEPINQDYGFVKYINRLLRIRKKGGKLFHKNKKGKFEGLTKTGSLICNILNKPTSWFTPHMIFIVARRI